MRSNGKLHAQFNSLIQVKYEKRTENFKEIRHSIKIIVFRILSIQNWRNRKVVFNVNNNWIIISPMDIQKVEHI